MNQSALTHNVQRYLTLQEERVQLRQRLSSLDKELKVVSQQIVSHLQGANRRGIKTENNITLVLKKSTKRSGITKSHIAQCLLKYGDTRDPVRAMEIVDCIYDARTVSTVVELERK